MTEKKKKKQEKKRGRTNKKDKKKKRTRAKTKEVREEKNELPYVPCRPSGGKALPPDTSPWRCRTSLGPRKTPASSRRSDVPPPLSACSLPPSPASRYGQASTVDDRRYIKVKPGKGTRRNVFVLWQGHGTRWGGAGRAKMCVQHVQRSGKKENSAPISYEIIKKNKNICVYTRYTCTTYNMI